MKHLTKSKTVSSYLVSSIIIVVVFSLVFITFHTAIQAKDSNEQAELLFVQSAEKMTFNDGTLTLHNVSPSVIFFSDRPQRIAGHITIDGFLQAWGEGEDSFAEDPPNANLSTLTHDSINNVVIELINPRMSGNTLQYDVVILEGELPTTGGMSSLFIDGLFAGGALRSGVRGTALGAIGGAIGGDVGTGMAIGAAVGLVGGAIQEDQDRRNCEYDRYRDCDYYRY
jgi:hypothetical protein